MNTLTNFAEAHAALRKFYGKHADGPYTLERMRSLMSYLGNPQDSLKIVHVAGTSGKTSTAYFISSLLQESGMKVGLTVSPHVDEINERVQIGLVPLPEAIFCKELTEFLKLIERSGILPSYFECMVAFAYWEFVRSRVDYAVVEVGLGGLLDGTNVAGREDKICVITDIGLDHTEILGDTLGQIATQKAGIIHNGNDVFMYAQDGEIMEAIGRVCGPVAGAKLHIVPQVSTCRIEGLPLFQERNFCLADAVAKQVFQRAGKPQLTPEQRQHAANVHIPARMEIIERSGKVVIIDGAHNAQKLETLFDSIGSKYRDQNITALIGFVEGDSSRLQRGLDVLMGHTQHLIATSFYSEKDYPKHSVSTSDIVNYCHVHGWSAIEAVDDPAVALGSLLARPEPVLLITGSFYLLNHVRPLLLGEDV